MVAHIFNPNICEAVARKSTFYKCSHDQLRYNDCNSNKYEVARELEQGRTCKITSSVQ